MKKKTKIIIATIEGLVLLIAVLGYTNPKLRVSLFVRAYTGNGAARVIIMVRHR